MYKLVLEKYKYGYWPVEAITLEGDILVNFLRTDVGGDSVSWLNWANRLQEYGGLSNATCVARDPECQDDILIWDALDDGDIEDIPHVVIKKNNFIELLNKWDELYKQRVPYIVLTIDDNGVTLEGKTSLEECTI